MHTSSLLPVVCLLAALPGSAIPQSAVADSNAIEIRGPTLVGYFPQLSEEEAEDPGAQEGGAHTQFALSDTKKCLGRSKIAVDVHFVFGSAFAVKDGNTTTRIALPTTWPEAAGAYLFLPGKPPRHVPAQAGPSSLIVLVPEAAAAYFNAPACKSD